ncbi:hypothetical protein LCGC14_0337270 [marine sediment metagenome]|uniref:DNA primase/polymerase bifunctional N-terminal domain-containing protein n=1 Tax=marine sediment metagenome TaxID=412755 RepID=A0A0F9TER8_9ZZZZ
MSYSREELADNKDLAIILLLEDKSPMQKISKENYVRVSDDQIKAHKYGFGLLAGERSKYGDALAEIIDIDLKYSLDGTLWKDYKAEIQAAAPGLLKKLVIHKTINSGFHFLYRCQFIEGNKKLAKRRDDGPSKTKVLIETRGEGGYVVVPPSKGYEVMNNSMLDLPEISVQEREVLFSCAKIFNETDDSELRTELASDRRMYNRQATRHEDNNPFEEYNKRGDVLRLLTDHGWSVAKEKGTKKLLKRPGETSNNYGADLDIIDGIYMFHVYTSSTQFQVDKTYSPSQIFTMLECDDDWTIAARKLRKDGYIKTPGKRRDIADVEFIQRPDNEIEATLKEARITSSTDVPPMYELIGINDTLVLSRGNVVGLSGAVKAGKSAIINLLLSKSINAKCEGFPTINVKENRGGKPVVHIDTEQSKSKHKENIMKWILPRTGFKETPPFFHSYNFRSYTVQQSREMLVWLLAKLYKEHGGIHMVLIDGISEFVRSPNDEEGCFTLVKLLMELSSQYDTGIVVVIHTNPTYENTTKERGHLGSELQRKAESMLGIVNDVANPKISIMNARWLRNGDKVDFGEIHYSFDSELMRHEQVGIQGEADEFTRLKAISQKIRNNTSITEARQMIVRGANVTTTKAKSMINNMKDLGLIEIQNNYIFRIDLTPIADGDNDNPGVEEEKGSAPF